MKSGLSLSYRFGSFSTAIRMAVFPAFAIGIALSACAEEPVNEFRYDRYSGVPVMTQKMAEAIMLHRHVNAPIVGERAPDGQLIDAVTGESKTLYQVIQDKPMVLLFGSSSCSNLDMYLENIKEIVERFQRRVDFSLIYIREAHPEGGFMPVQMRDGKEYHHPSLPDSKSIEERKKQALGFQKNTTTGLRAFVDSLDDEMAVRWGAWPVRTFVIGTDRKVLYTGGPGPFYFHLTKDGWHTTPDAYMAEEFLRMPFSRESLEEFLVRYEGNGPLPAKGG
jgi:thiol-disulfide isomerase/thioredoxin